MRSGYARFTDLRRNHAPGARSRWLLARAGREGWSGRLAVAMHGWRGRVGEPDAGVLAQAPMVRTQPALTLLLLGLGFFDEFVRLVLRRI